MNERIRELFLKSLNDSQKFCYQRPAGEVEYQKFAELIVEECRNIVTEVYRNTPLELCGPLLTADERIAKHFYGVKE
jgi:hypothetical protein